MPSVSITTMSPSRTAAIGPRAVGFRSHVADHQPARRATEPAIGDQRHLLAQPLPHDGRGDAEHFAHARAAARTLVADDDDVAGA